MSRRENTGDCSRILLAYKVCPICGTPAHRNATLCSTCGTTLTSVEPVIQEKKRTPAYTYDRQHGETDLLEGDLSRRGPFLLFSALLVVTMLICAGAVLFAAASLVTTANRPAERDPIPITESAITDAAPALGPVDDSAPLLISTNTPRPTMIMATITPAPPTETPIPTPGPCEVRVQTGDDLITLAYGCGHRSLEIIPVILELNNLRAPEAIQAGQTLIIPWPTPTPDPDALVPEENPPLEETGAENSSANSAVVFREPASVAQAQAPTARPTATLLPGVQWHTVQPNESIATISYLYRTRAETLAQLNPEIPFSQCDFRYEAGGARCQVILRIGQQIRVPAPTPTPTLPPTLTGSETPTPSPTPTFNAPSPLSPGDRALFRNGDLITLRWVSTGTLGPGEVYRVTVDDLTRGERYTTDTTELFFIVPEAWQGDTARRHDYEWRVSVIHIDDPDTPIFTTQTRLFTWEGREGTGR
jgi:LysM repeat protein